MSQQKLKRRYKKKLMSHRHRHLARLMICNPHWSYAILAKEAKYSRRQVIYITRKKAFRDHLLHLQDMADANAVGYRTVVQVAAKRAVDLLVSAITPGSKDYEAATPRIRIQAAIELIDRSGLAPKVKHVKSNVTRHQGTAKDYLKEIIASEASAKNENPVKLN